MSKHFCSKCASLVAYFQMASLRWCHSNMLHFYVFNLPFYTWLYVIKLSKFNEFISVILVFHSTTLIFYILCSQNFSLSLPPPPAFGNILCPMYSKPFDVDFLVAVSNTRFVCAYFGCDYFLENFWQLGIITILKSL